MGRGDNALVSLAREVGVDAEASPSTVRRLLTAMGCDASSAAGVRRALAALEEERRSSWLGPVHVVRGARSVVLEAAPWSRGAVRFELTVALEGGGEVSRRGEARRGRGRMEIPLPRTPIGYHELSVTLTRAGERREASCPLIVAPKRAVTPRDLEADRAHGVWTNLYSLRSERNWGFGDLGDLGRLVPRVAAAGGDFVGLNPLHSIRNAARECSPYSPLSRRYLSELYLDVPRIPEWKDLPDATRRAWESDAMRARLRRLRAADRIDYDAVRELKERFFVPLHAAFRRRHAKASSARGRAWRRFVAEAGEPLRRHATFLALDDHFYRPRRGWRGWPAAYRDPDGAAVREFQARHRHSIERSMYLAFELDRQLGAVAARCRRSGMKLGLYRDLAIGSAPEGSDVWSDRELFVLDASVGAPPDAFASTGQVWNLPPLHPRVLRRRGYRDFTELLRANLAHSGLLRIDHVIGLVRQFWIPRGRTGRDGAFVRYPADDLFAILALESVRHQAVVVGEDLGTVPDELPPLMRAHGVLQSDVLLFHLGVDGLPPSRSFRRSALATVGTHDHAPLAGFVRGDDLPIRRRLGLLSRAAEARVRRERDAQVRAMIRQFHRRGWLRSLAPCVRDVVWAMHRYLASTPGALKGISLDDLAVETTPVNVPTATPARYPVWSRRMSRPVEGIDLDLAR